jgi:pyridoxal phosphate enzyme (YggS family)
VPPGHPQQAGFDPGQGAPAPTDVDAFARSREGVLARIAAACTRSGREPSAVTLVAVSKTVDVVRLRAALAAGLSILGENRVQEAAAKGPEVDGATWHLVGPLQGNKVRRAVELFAVIQSVDSVALARRLDAVAGELRPGEPLPVLLQVNVDADPAKAGFGSREVAEALPEVLALANLRVDGLMTIGRLVADPAQARETFRELRLLSEELREGHPRLGAALSMGMTDDFEVAVEEGATIVRVGRALFGVRQAVGEDRPPA